MRKQAWLDKMQEIACDFVQDDDELGELMLDHCEWYWEECFEEGLTPQQALEEFIHKLSTAPILQDFKHWRESNK